MAINPVKMGNILPQSKLPVSPPPELTDPLPSSNLSIVKPGQPETTTTPATPSDAAAPKETTKPAASAKPAESSSDLLKVMLPLVINALQLMVSVLSGDNAFKGALNPAGSKPADTEDAKPKESKPADTPAQDMTAYDKHENPSLPVAASSSSCGKTVSSAAPKDTETPKMSCGE
jgi:hypothetical protein